MSDIGLGDGQAFDAGVVIDTSPDPVDEIRLAAGREQAKAILLAEAEISVERAKKKRDRAAEDVAAADLAVAEAEAALAALQEG